MNFVKKIGYKAVFLLLLGLADSLAGQSVTGPVITLNPSADALCLSNPFISFLIGFEDNGSFGTQYSYIIYEFSEDGTEWTQFYTSNSSSWAYTQRPENLPEGWYRVSAAHMNEVDQPDKWISSVPVYMERIEGGCTPFKHPWQDEISDDVCPQGTLLFREDFGGNDPTDPVTSQERMTTMSSRYRQVFDVMTRVNSGKFIVAKRGWQNNLQTSTTAPLYSQWFIQDDHTYPNDYTRGYLMEVDGIGGNDAFYTTTFPVCHELDLSFSAYVANVLEPGHNFARPKVRFLIQNDLTGDTILEQSSGPIAPAPADYSVNGQPLVQSAPWHLVGASFHVPEGVSLLRLSIFNDEAASTGNDFAMDDIEIRLCKQQVTIDSEPEICMDSTYRFHAVVTPNGGFKEPYQFLWQFAKDSLPYNSDGWISVKKGLDLTFDSARLDQTGWYRLCLTSDGIDVETERFCRAASEPFYLKVNDCTPPCPEIIEETEEITVCDTLLPYSWHDTVFHKDTTYEIMYYNKYGCLVKKGTYTLRTEVCCPEVLTVRRDTTVCDTLMPFTWNGLLFEAPGSQKTMLQDSRGCDTLETTWTLSTEICCYDLQYAPPIDTAVCDTLLPFMWNGVLFVEPSEQEVMELSPRGCDSILHTYTVDTFHCERLYPIIVNKYNWQLLSDNIALRRLFPDRTATAFQWYKNDSAVPGATEDDYAEQNELHGRFQLRVMLDGGQAVWSNILEISDSIEEISARVRIYDSHGTEVCEDQITHGIYLFRYEQGDYIRTEKKMIP
ncbi:MAG: hypothetical protein J6M55_03510 [Paludibacteraceae bacterium]|nr:hypothetical protein [Paludibacteraceae bacterium]